MFKHNTFISAPPFMDPGNSLCLGRNSKKLLNESGDEEDTQEKCAFYVTERLRNQRNVNKAKDEKSIIVWVIINSEDVSALGLQITT